MTYTELVQATLTEIDTTDAELRAFCQAYEQAQSKTKLPTPEEWQAFHAYHDRIKQLKALRELT